MTEEPVEELDQADEPIEGEPPDSTPRVVRRREALAAVIVALAVGLGIGVIAGASLIASRATDPPDTAEITAAIDALSEKIDGIDSGAGRPRSTSESAPASPNERSGRTMTPSKPATSPPTAGEAPSDPPDRPDDQSAPRSPTDDGRPTSPNDAETRPEEPSHSAKPPNPSLVVSEVWVNIIRSSGDGSWESDWFTLADRKTRVFYGFFKTSAGSKASMFLVPKGDNASKANQLTTDGETGSVTLEKPSAGAGEYRIVAVVDGQFTVSVQQLK